MEATAQDLDQIGKQEPVAVSGGASLNQVFYSSFRNESRRDPYSFVAAGNLNLSIYGWSVPLSFTFSNQGSTFQQPFNQYSIHPAYKSVQAHIGNVSASYSPYTVNGHNFLGAAIDYEPEGKLKVSGLCGRFLRAAPYDSVSGQTPSYKRMGYGTKMQFMHGNEMVQLNLFHAADDETSLGYVPDSLELHPQENLVVSLGGSTLLFSKILVKGEIASSGITSDISSSPEKRDEPIAILKPLFTTRTTTAFFNAWRANIDYQLQSSTVGIGYERIEPGYKTFGSYYFNSDLENITMNAASSILEGTMSVTASLGVQRDNLDGAKVSTLKRSVGSINLNYSPTEKISFAGSYSTFQTFTNIRPQFQELNQFTPYDNIDTLNFTQLSRSATLTAAYSFGLSPDKKQSLNLNASVQDASEQQGQVVGNEGTVFCNVNTTYALNLPPQGMMLSVSVNGSLNDGIESRTTSYGPVVSILKSFLEKKLKANWSVSYLRAGSDSGTANTLITSRVGGNLNLAKGHHVNLTISAFHRSSIERSQFEMTMMLGYSFNFSADQNKK
ncbi:MAG TPA: hypothetical protein VGD65_21590 [Chryseosolibacter sp.]